MKREGRQHGMVLTYPIIDPNPLSQQHYVKNNPAIVTSMSTKVWGKPAKFQQRYVENNTVVPCIVFGTFAKVSGKPTNQTKVKCNEYFISPAAKAREAKGTMKLRSIEESDPELVSCGAGASATRAFAYLAGEGGYTDHEYEEGEFDNYESDYDSDTTFDEYEGELGTVSKEPIRVEAYSEDDEWCLVE